MDAYGYLDLAGIVFSLSGLAFVDVGSFGEVDGLWVGVILTGFLMWGIQAYPRRGKPNLPVRFPPYTPREPLVCGAGAWGVLAVLVTFIMVWVGGWEVPAVLLPVAATVTAWRAFSIYAWEALKRSTMRV